MLLETFTKRSLTPLDLRTDWLRRVRYHLLDQSEMLLKCRCVVETFTKRSLTSLYIYLLIVKKGAFGGHLYFEMNII